MPELLFDLKHVGFSYPGAIPALRDITLSIHSGERIAVIGANGTGKSTLLAMLDALIFPETGELYVFGEKIDERVMNDQVRQRSFRSKVGFVFQDPDVQLFCPTIREDIVFGPLQLGTPKQVIEERLEQVLGLLKLHHLLERSPHQLSFGEKKKAAIASVLIMEPEVLLLDEPTAGLDPQTTRDIIAVLYAAHQAGKTIVLATHDLHIVEELADRIHVFNQNNTIVRKGSPDEILSDRPFLQKHNLIHVHAHRHRHTSHLHPH